MEAAAQAAEAIHEHPCHKQRKRLRRRLQLLLAVTWLLFLAEQPGHVLCRELLEDDPPPRPPVPPPPPPAHIGSASTSLKFFQLLYSGNGITEIRITRDITLTAADAVRAAAAAAANATTGSGSDSGDNSTYAGSDGGEPPAPLPALGVGLGARAPLLTTNMTILGASRGTNTQLDFNFLSALLRLAPGVTLTLRNLEVYKALNHVGQSLDFVGKSEGGRVALENCVQRRGACVPFVLAFPQILSLPAARDIADQPPRDVSIRNDSAFCWSTSTLLPTCKSRSLEVAALAVHVPPAEGILSDSGGYDVAYKDSHIVCDHVVAEDCLRTSSAERCLAQELLKQFGSGAAPAPPDWAGGTGGGGGSGGGRAAAASRGGGPPAPAVIGLAAGLGGGGGALLLLSILAVFLVRQRQRRRRRQADEEAAGGGGGAGRPGTALGSEYKDEGGGDGGAGGSSVTEDHLGNLNLSPMGPGDTGAVGLIIRRQGTASTESGGGGGVAAAGRKSVVDPDSSGRGGAGGGGAATGPRTSSSSRGTSSEARGLGGGSGTLSGSSRRLTRAAVAAASLAAATTTTTTTTAAAGGLGTPPRVVSLSDPWDVESIRRSLFIGARNPDTPLAVQLVQLIGEGSFGKVYKAIWHGTLVALKVLVLSGNLTQDQRRRQMAVMEAAISSSMSHPNIVQTYTYSFRPIRETVRTGSDPVPISGGSTPPQPGTASAETGAGSSAAAAGAGGGAGPAASEPEGSRLYGHELLLVLEYCDRGSLRQALDAGLFHRRPVVTTTATATTAATAAAAATTAPGAAPEDGAGGGRGRNSTPECRSPSRGGSGGGANTVGAESLWLTPAAEFSTLTGLPPPPQRRPSQTAAAATAGGDATRSWRSEEGRGPSLMSRRSGEARSAAGAYNYGLMLQVACDVASALLHLHSHGVVHGDVKASNVLLKTAPLEERRPSVPPLSPPEGPPPPPDAAVAERRASGGGGGGGGGARTSAVSAVAAAAAAAAAAVVPYPPSSSASATTAVSTTVLGSPGGLGLVAKVADFGLSTVLGFEGDTEVTHISALTAQGSLTHMAPELMLHGHISKRVDVYAFGIMLFELFTGERAHRGVPRALLPHQVAMCGLRPALPPYTPADYRALTEACWQADASKRPTFEVILRELNRMRQVHAAATTAAAIAAAGSRGASFTTSSTPSPSSGPASASTSAFAAAGGGVSGWPAASRATQPDGWVQLPTLEASTCSSTLFAELVRTSADAAEAAVCGGDGGGGGVGAAGAGAAGAPSAAAAGGGRGGTADAVAAGAPEPASLPGGGDDGAGSHGGGGGGGGEGAGGEGTVSLVMGPEEGQDAPAAATTAVDREGGAGDGAGGN